MKLEIKRLLAKAQYTGDFSYRFKPSVGSVIIPLCGVDEVELFGSYEIFDDGSVEVRFTIGYTLKGQCSYCLQPAEKKVEYSAEALFVTEDDGENYLYDGCNLDLEQAVNDAFLFSQPKVLLCKEGCEGIKINQEK